MATVTCNIGPLFRRYGGPCPTCATEFEICNPTYTYESSTFGTPPITITVCYQDCNIYCDTSGCGPFGCWDYVA